MAKNYATLGRLMRAYPAGGEPFIAAVQAALPGVSRAWIIEVSAALWGGDLRALRTPEDSRSP